MALSYKNPHEQSCAVAKQELQTLEEEAAQLNERLKWVCERIGYLKDYLKAIEPLIQQDPGQALLEVGLTQICRNMLEHANVWLTPQQVKNRLELAGIDLQGYTNPMAVLHSVLKRVGDSFKGADGTVYYGKKGLEPKEPTKQAEGLMGYTHPAYMPATSDPITATRRGLKDLMGGRRLPTPTMPPPEEIPELTNPEDEQKRKK
jgi:hypothetical protein